MIHHALCDAMRWYCGWDEQQYRDYRDKTTCRPEEKIERRALEATALTKFLCEVRRYRTKEELKRETQARLARLKELEAENDRRLAAETRERLAKARTIARRLEREEEDFEAELYEDERRACEAKAKRKAKPKAAWIARAKARLETDFIQRG